MEIKKIKYAEYRNIAYSFLSKVGIDRNSKFPFEIDIYAEKGGYYLNPIPNLCRDYGVKGGVLKLKGGGFEIAIDENHYFKEEFYFPFTIAEELGHILAHAHIYNQLSSIEDIIKFNQSLTDNDYHILENQARNVGSFILLPEYLFNNYVLNYCKENITEIQETTFYIKDELADFIANGVSRKISLSSKVLFKVIAYRYPDLLIDKIIDYFGINLIL